ncbi:MAG: hypothetical protein HZB22_07515 [Deltaproteobacteria bacterium]|nr:hypothetical protein [Deltaproteobacteria bacterium]
MDQIRSIDAREGRARGEGGAIRLLAAFFFTMICGAFLAYYSSMYVSGGFSVRRFDILSESDNPELSASSQLPAKERVEAKGRDLTLLWLDGGRQSIPFRSEDRSTLAVRMNAYFPEVKYNRPELNVSVNGREIETVRPKWKGGMEKLDFDIPGTALAKGKNLLTFGLTKGASYRIGYESVNARDFAGVSKRFPKAYVLFDENMPGRALNPYARPYDYILYPASVFLIWVIGANLIRAGRGTTALKGSKTLFYAYLPVCVLFIVSALFSALSRYTVVLDRTTFHILAFAPGILCVSYGLLLYLRGRARFKEERDETRKMAGERAAPYKLRFIGRGFKFIYRNAGSIAIVVFAVFLSGAGVFLMLKRQDIADNLADIAYFSIVFAVIVRAFELRGDGERGE